MNDRASRQGRARAAATSTIDDVHPSGEVPAGTGDNPEKTAEVTARAATATLTQPPAQAWSWPLPPASPAGRSLPARAGGTPVSFGPEGKRRSVIAVIGLSIVTLGVYALVWHHRINREMGNYETRMHVRPGRSTLAVTIPWILGWLISIAGAVRIVLAVLNVGLPFDPRFSVTQAYLLLGGILLIPYLELLMPFSAVASVMTLERVRIVEDRLGRTTDVQLRPTTSVAWMLLPVAGGLVLMATVQRRLNQCWGGGAAAAVTTTATRRTS